MNEPEQPPSPVSPPETTSPAPPPDSNPALAIFWGPNGLRAGWRLLMFFAICAIVLFGVGFVSRHLFRRGAVINPFDPEVLLRGEAVIFGVILFASWIMSKFEEREIADYGLPLRTAFRGDFWKGIVIGFASISALLAALRVAGVFQLGEPSLHGAELWRNASLWACTFLFVALFEEFCFRGYALLTLVTGTGFWPAAFVCSAVFGAVHIGNSGETWLGALSAGLIGLLFCLMLRRTGSLWLPIGFHASWDWGETFFYGVPDSGEVAPGHLFSATLSGSKWLSGGSVGPEASVLCIFLIVVLLVLFAILYPEVRYPNRAEQRNSPSESRNRELHT